ncbi:unnamed protein product [Meganyctiphanes norvegica]|uniref:Uncharacterized protein n=1 Tax=Meganyctiphanes norvegica TaxID=48144 RepID=A0AAV2PS83_MEGNR
MIIWQVLSPGGAETGCRCCSQGLETVIRYVSPRQQQPFDLRPLEAPCRGPLLPYYDCWSHFVPQKTMDLGLKHGSVDGPAQRATAAPLYRTERPSWNKR